MGHEFAVRFEPSSGVKLVQAEAYVRSLEAILEGLGCLRAALAPQLAEKHGWAVPQIRAALTFSVGPTAKGSLVVPLIPGAAEKGPPLAVDAIARAFFRETALELAGVPKRRATFLSATGAEAFARASSAAKDSHAKVGLASRPRGGRWRSAASLTVLEPALRKHAESRRSGHRALTSLTGQIASLTYDPPGFILVTPNARHSVRMSSALRDAARDNWGRDVVVTTDASVAADGSVADIRALEIRPAATAKAAAERFEETFGLMRGAWDSDAVGAHLSSRH